MSETNPNWDQALAEALIGKTVLIGLTKLRDGKEEQVQMFGTITAIGPAVGITAALEGTRAAAATAYRRSRARSAPPRPAATACGRQASS